MLCNDHHYFKNFFIIPRREILLKHRSEVRGYHCSASQHPVALHFTQERPRFFLGHMTLCATLWPLTCALRPLRFLASLLSLQEGIKLLLQVLCTCFSLFWIFLPPGIYSLSSLHSHLLKYYIRKVSVTPFLTQNHIPVTLSCFFVLHGLA